MCSISSNNIIVPSTTTSIPSTSSTSSSITSSSEGSLPPTLVSLVLDYLMIGPNLTLYPQKVEATHSDVYFMPKEIKSSLFHVFKIGELNNDRAICFNFQEINNMITECRAIVDYFKGDISEYRNRLLFFYCLPIKQFKEEVNHNGAYGEWGLKEILTNFDRGGPLMQASIGHGVIHDSARIKMGNIYRLFLDKFKTEINSVSTALKEVDILKNNTMYYLDYVKSIDEKGSENTKLIIKEGAKRGLLNHMLFTIDDMTDTEESTLLYSSEILSNFSHYSRNHFFC